MVRAARLKGDQLKLNVGCGPNVKSGWINIDLSQRADLQLDLREPLPFASQSVAVIYSEHFFEHLEYPDEATNFLLESIRILRPGGIFSVGVPDTEWPLVSYVTGDDMYFRMAQERWHPSWCVTKMHSLNYHFRQGREHKFAYDFETLSLVLREAGFSPVERREFNADLDDESRKDGTLYVDAYKPTNH